jgi:hypothetical protein
MTRMQMMRERTMKRDSWNMFVGETRYKTNFFLRFLDHSTKAVFERQNLCQSSSLYSVRCLLSLYTLVLYYTDNPAARGSQIMRLLILILTSIISFVGTFRLEDSNVPLIS